MTTETEHSCPGLPEWYDAMTVREVQSLLRGLDDYGLRAVRSHERATKARTTILQRRELTSLGADDPMYPGCSRAGLTALEAALTPDPAVIATPIQRITANPASRAARTFVAVAAAFLMVAIVAIVRHEEPSPEPAPTPPAISTAHG